jgi:hypothetical protein
MKFPPPQHAAAMASYETPSGKPGRTAAAAPPELIARRAVQAACFGFFVDMFEVYLPIAVLAPALVYFVPGGLSGAAQATMFYVVFAVSLELSGRLGDEVDQAAW